MWRRVAAIVPASMLVVSAAASPCQRTTPISVTEMIQGADLIVRATASDDTVPPVDDSIRTTGEPDSRIRFVVREVLKGAGAGAQFVLPG